MIDLLIITGASKGIGASIVTKCSDICKNMILVSRSLDYTAWMNNQECNFFPLSLDLTNYHQVKEVISKVISDYGQIGSLGIILCGAQIGESGGLLSSDLDDWDRLYQCNVLGNLAIIQGCSELIKSGIKTRIVFFAGGGSGYNYEKFSGYALSKVSVVRAVENFAEELKIINKDASIIALAPGAILTDLLSKVIANGGEIRTRTSIQEPTNFVYYFLEDQFNSKELNGRFLHVRDNISSIDFSNSELFKLRRIQ